MRRGIDSRKSHARVPSSGQLCGLLSRVSTCWPDTRFERDRYSIVYRPARPEKVISSSTLELYTAVSYYLITWRRRQSTHWRFARFRGTMSAVRHWYRYKIVLRVNMFMTQNTRILNRIEIFIVFPCLAVLSEMVQASGIKRRGRIRLIELFF